MPGRSRMTTAAALALTCVALAVIAGLDRLAWAERRPAVAAPPPAPAVAPTQLVSLAPAPFRAAPPQGGPTGTPVSESEALLTARMRLLVDADPAAAVALCDDGERRFPAGATADERSFLRMRALVNLGRIAAARDEAQDFFERFPESPFREDAYRLTGVHPRPGPPSGVGPP